MGQLRFTTAVAVLAPLFFACCSKSSDRQVSPSADLKTPPAATATPHAPQSPPVDSPPPAPALHVIDEKRFAEILQEHRGEVVLVDFWATWCIECLELMPHTVELHKELGGQGLHVMLISLDSPEDRRETIEKLMVKNGVTFDGYISQYGGDPKSAEAFEIEGAALPNIKLYDRTGKLHKVFSAGRMPPEPFEAQDIEKAVRALLAEKTVTRGAASPTGG